MSDRANERVAPIGAAIVWPTTPGPAIVFDAGWSGARGQIHCVGTSADSYFAVVARDQHGGELVRLEVPWHVLRAALGARDEELLQKRILR
jgi:hypothetical protein